jgi:hypothetical protein
MIVSLAVAQEVKRPAPNQLPIGDEARQQRGLPNRQPSFDSSLRADGTLDLAKLWSQGRAEGTGPVRFTHSPMRLPDI